MKLSTSLIAVLAGTEARRWRRQGGMMTETTSTTASTTTASTETTTTTEEPVTAAAGTFLDQISGADVNFNDGTSNINIMPMADGTVMVVITNNADNLVIATSLATVDEAGMQLTGLSGLPDGSTTAVWDAAMQQFTTDTGAVWPLGAALTTTTAPAVGSTTGPNGGNPYAPGMSSTAAPGGAYGGSGSTAAPYNGGGTGGSTDSYAPAGTGYIANDPHVRVTNEIGQAICYDLPGDGLSFISLLKDNESGLEVNGFISNTHKHRLSGIGIKTPAGVEIAIDSHHVTVGFEGDVEGDYNYDSYMKVQTDDALVEITSKLEAKHQGVFVELDDGTFFHIDEKDIKDTLKFVIAKSTGLSNHLSGMLGQTIQPQDFRIHPDGSIEVEGRWIMKTTLDAKHSCFRLAEWDIHNFLGHNPADYAVENMFATLDHPWASITAQLEEDSTPK